MEKLNQLPTGESEPCWLSDSIMEDYNFSPEEFNQNLLDIDDVGVGECITHDIASAIQKQFSSSKLTSKTLIMNHSSSSSVRPTKLLKKRNNIPKNKSNLSSSIIITESYLPKPFTFSSSSPSNLSFQSRQILNFDNSNSSSSYPTTQFYGELDCTLTPKQNEVVSVSLQSQLENTHFSVQNSNVPKKTRSLGTKTKHKKPALANAKDHVIAERKRREKLSQSFIALAVLLPCPKKMDKATVLEDTIKYVKELKDRQALLEEEIEKIKTEFAAVVQKKASELRYGAGGDSSSSSCDIESTDGPYCTESVLQVEAKASIGQEVLIRIHCQKQEGILVKILAEIQSLHLSVLTCSALPFGNSILDITIIVQMDEGYNLTLEELVRTIRMATLKFIS